MTSPNMGYETRAALVWDKLESIPGFNEGLRQAEAELTAGGGVPFEDVDDIDPNEHPADPDPDVPLFVQPIEDEDVDDGQAQDP